MAKIIYGVCGEGMGHAVRSRPIIEHLMKKHDIIIYSSGRAFEYLSEYFKNVKKVKGMFLVYKNNSVDEVTTTLLTISKIPLLLRSSRRVLSDIRKEKSDLVISDFEITTSYAAKKAKIPLISIDNQHISKARVYLPKMSFFNDFESGLVNKIVIPKAKHYIVTSFFYPRKKPSNMTIIPPVIREEVRRLKPAEGKHVLVYQTSDTNNILISELKKTGVRIIAYGFNKDSVEENIQFRKFDERSFLEDLRKCRAVITNGGFTVITEALYLGKPVLSIPVRRHFEQRINSVNLDLLGLGKNMAEADSSEILAFVNNLDMYKEKINKHRKTFLKKFEVIDKMINKVIKEKEARS